MQPCICTGVNQTLLSGSGSVDHGSGPIDPKEINGKFFFVIYCTTDAVW